MIKKPNTFALKCTSEEFRNDFQRNSSGQQSPSPQILISSHQPQILKKQPLVLEESRERFTGTLKFFDEIKSYGFLIMDVDNSEIFVHFDDFDKSQGLQREMLMSYKLGNIIRVSFICMKYIGKYNMSRKAVDVKVVSTTF